MGSSICIHRLSCINCDGLSYHGDVYRKANRSAAYVACDGCLQIVCVWIGLRISAVEVTRQLHAWKRRRRRALQNYSITRVWNSNCEALIKNHSVWGSSKCHYGYASLSCNRTSNNYISWIRGNELNRDKSRWTWAERKCDRVPTGWTLSHCERCGNWLGRDSRLNEDIIWWGRVT